jgi:hypothetical protein
VPHRFTAESGTKILLNFVRPLEEQPLDLMTPVGIRVIFEVSGRSQSCS